MLSDEHTRAKVARVTDKKRSLCCYDCITQQVRLDHAKIAQDAVEKEEEED